MKELENILKDGRLLADEEELQAAIAELDEIIANECGIYKRDFMQSKMHAELRNAKLLQHTLITKLLNGANQEILQVLSNLQDEQDLHIEKKETDGCLTLMASIMRDFNCFMRPPGTPPTNGQEAGIDQLRANIIKFNQDYKGLKERYSYVIDPSEGDDDEDYVTRGVAPARVTASLDSLAEIESATVRKLYSDYRAKHAPLSPLQERYLARSKKVCEALEDLCNNQRGDEADWFELHPKLYNHFDESYLNVVSNNLPLKKLQLDGDVSLNPIQWADNDVTGELYSDGYNTDHSSVSLGIGGGGGAACFCERERSCSSKCRIFSRQSCDNS